MSIYFVPECLASITLTVTVRSKDDKMHILVIHLLAAWSSPSSDVSEQRKTERGRGDGRARVAVRLKVYVLL